MITQHERKQIIVQALAVISGVVSDHPAPHIDAIVERRGHSANVTALLRNMMSSTLYYPTDQFSRPCECQILKIYDFSSLFDAANIDIAENPKNTPTIIQHLRNYLLQKIYKKFLVFEETAVSCTPPVIEALRNSINGFAVLHPSCRYHEIIDFVDELVGTNTLAVITHPNPDSWRIRATTLLNKPLCNKYNLPEALRGKREHDLVCDLGGPSQGLFVHATGFTAGAKTLRQIFAMINHGAKIPIDFSPFLKKYSDV